MPKATERVKARVTVVGVPSCLHTLVSLWTLPGEEGSTGFQRNPTRSSAGSLYDLADNKQPSTEAMPTNRNLKKKERGRKRSSQVSFSKMTSWDSLGSESP